MAENEQTKVCPHCAETIKAAAKVCPRCRSRLQAENGAFVAGLKLFGFFVLLYGPLLLGAWLVGDARRPGRSFEPYRDKIVVLDTTIHYSRSNSTNVISTVGYLRNDSPYSWKALQLEVQYFDGAGKLVDTRTEALQYQELPAGMTEAFRIRTATASDESLYVSNKVFVRAAKDVRKIWNSED
jgi:hypothetical protein